MDLFIDELTGSVKDRDSKNRVSLITMQGDLFIATCFEGNVVYFPEQYTFKDKANLDAEYGWKRIGLNSKITNYIGKHRVEDCKEIQEFRSFEHQAEFISLTRSALLMVGGLLWEQIEADDNAVRFSIELQRKLENGEFVE